MASPTRLRQGVSFRYCSVFRVRRQIYLNYADICFDGTP